MEAGHSKLTARERVARRYNAARRYNYFKVGDMIVFKLHVSSKQTGISSKMKPRCSGRVTIASFLRPNDVQLANPGTCIIASKAHVSQLKLFFRIGAVGQRHCKGVSMPRSKTVFDPRSGEYLNHAGAACFIPWAPGSSSASPLEMVTVNGWL